MPLSDTLRAKLATLPEAPGVYIFKDRNGKIIYIGKAVNLKHRVRSYFTAGDDGRYNYPKLVTAIRDWELLLTRDEVEALATEAALVRLHSPIYNVFLKDDKSFPYIKVTREPFPRVIFTREKHTPHADYYGPFTDARNTRWLLRTLKGILQIRECDLPLTPEKISAGKFKLCLDYHMRRCGGPCEALVDMERYRRGVDMLVKFFQGKHDEIITFLEKDMRELSVKLRFEEAAKARDRLHAARRFTERQKKVSPRAVNRDAIGLVREDSYAAFSVIRVRNGRIVGQSPFHMERAAQLDTGELLEAFLTRHYELTDFIPGEILLPNAPPDFTTMAKFLSQKAGRSVHLHIPQRGEKRKLIQTAVANAGQLLLERRIASEKRDFIPRSLKALQEHLNLPTPPLIIEAFDISNLHGVDSVASLVCFKDGKPFKSAYRIFKIKTVEGIDDFASIGEAVMRRYSRLQYELENDYPDEAFTNSGEESGGKAKKDIPRLPDLVLIDGGAGQLSKAKAALVEINLDNLPVVGLAKRLEEIYFPGSTEPMTLPRTSSALRLLQQVRDEAHRFALSKHRLLRGKRQVKSLLDDIPGIGPNRRETLLKRFGSLKRIAEASVEELAAAPGMTRRAAEDVKRALGIAPK